MTTRPSRFVIALAAALFAVGAVWLAPPAAAHRAHRTRRPAPTRPTTPPPAPTVHSVGGRLVFVDAHNLVSVWADGTHRLETNFGGAYLGDATVSRDGTRVAFTVYPAGLNPNLREIWVSPVDMSSPPRLVAGEAGRFVYEPTWSPDGRRLAYVVGYPAGYFGLGYQSHLWVMNADGTDRRPVAATPGAIQQPEWSPNGDRVAFVVDGQELSPLLDVVSVDATPPVPAPITPLGMIGVSKPHWSPAGDRLSFETGDSLYTVRPDGTQLMRLAEGKNYPWDGGAVWSPDGQWLAFCNSSSGYFFGGASGSGLKLVSADGTQRRALGLRPCFWADWSPDGHAIGYAQAGDRVFHLIISQTDGSDSRDLGPGGAWLNWHDE